jgi:short-subunit dehydrogenase
MNTPAFSGRRALEGRGRTALVTGASSGIGRSTTELLTTRGFDVVVVARREDRLNASKEELEPRWDVTVRPLVADLAEPATPATIVEALDRCGV